MRRFRFANTECLAIACIVLALTACQPHQGAIRADTRAVAMTCAAQCLTTCLPSEWPQWTGDPESPATWDELPPVAAELRGIAERCDIARASCVACLKRPEAAGVICGVTEPCR